MAPAPPDSGLRLLQHNLLRVQAAKHRMTIVSAIRDSTEHDALQTLEQLGVKVLPIRLPNTRSPVHRAGYRLKHGIAAMAPRSPVTVRYATPPAVRRAIGGALADESYDLVEVHGSVMASALRGLPSHPPSVLYLYDLQHVLLEQAADLAPSPVARAWTRHQARLMLRHEQRWLRAHSLVLATQSGEAEIACGLGAAVEAMPLAMDLDALRPPVDDPVPARVVFTGVMNYHPNVAAMVEFVRSCWPAIIGRIPNATLEIVGHSPTPEVVALADHHGVTVTGRVDRPADHLLNASCTIIPTRLGTGVKVKLLEALSLGRAVVAAPESVRGLSQEVSSAIITAGSADAFADAVCRVLEQRDLRRKHEAAAREVALRSWSFDAAAMQLKHVYERVTHG